MPGKVHCGEFEDLAVLYAAGEIDVEVRAGVEEHARECEACAAMLHGEMLLREAIAMRGEAAGKLDASGLLLARCRSELAETLDDRENGGGKAGWRERMLLWLSPARWAAEFRSALMFHPGWSTAALLVVGALGGMAVRTLYSETSLPLPGKPAMTVSAAPRLNEQELETMGVQGIHLEPQDGGAAPEVEVQMLSQHPVTVQGTLDDGEIKRLLIYIVEHGQRFDPGVRLDSLDVLRTRVGDSQVRAALCAAARQDDNPAVRLKALEALQGLGADRDVQQTLLGVLAGDDNSGVRIEAVNALAALGNSDMRAMMKANPQALTVLSDRERNDLNSYVRLRSGAALWRLTSAKTGTDAPEANSAERAGGAHP